MMMGATPFQNSSSKSHNNSKPHNNNQKRIMD